MLLGILSLAVAYDPGTHNVTFELEDDNGNPAYVVLPDDQLTGTLEEVCEGGNGRPVESLEECAHINENFIHLGTETLAADFARQWTVRGCVINFNRDDTGDYSTVIFNDEPGNLDYVTPNTFDPLTYHVRVICRVNLTVPAYGDYFDNLATGQPTVAPTVAPTSSFPTALPTLTPTNLVLPVSDWHGELCEVSGCQEDHRLTYRNGNTFYSTICFAGNWDGFTLARTAPEQCPVCNVTSKTVSDRNHRTILELAQGITIPVYEIQAECDDYPCDLFHGETCNLMMCMWDERGFCREPDFDNDPIAKINLAHGHLDSASYHNSRSQFVDLTPKFDEAPYVQIHENYAANGTLIDVVHYIMPHLARRIHVDMSNPAHFCETFRAFTKEAVVYRGYDGQFKTRNAFTIQYRAICDANTGMQQDFTIAIVPACDTINRIYNCTKYGCLDPAAEEDPDLNLHEYDLPAEQSMCRQYDLLTFEQVNRITLIQVSRSGIDAENVPTPGVYTHSPVTPNPTAAPTTLSPTYSPTPWRPGPNQECELELKLQLDESHGAIEHYHQDNSCDVHTQFRTISNDLHSCARYDIGSDFVSGMHACLLCSTPAPTALFPTTVPQNEQDRSCKRNRCGMYNYNATECILNWCVVDPHGACREPEHSNNLFRFEETYYEAVYDEDPASPYFNTWRPSQRNSEFTANIQKIYLFTNTQEYDVPEAGTASSFVTSDNVNIPNLVTVRGLDMRRMISPRTFVDFKDVQLHNAYFNPIASLAGACASMRIEHVDGRQYFASCAEDPSIENMGPGIIGVKFTTDEADPPAPPQQEYRWDINRDPSYFLVYFQMQTLSPTQPPTFAPTLSPVPSLSPTISPTTYLIHFCRPQGDEVCPSSLPFSVAGDSPISNATKHVLAPVLEDGSGYHFCQSPANTQDNAGNLLCLGCNLQGSTAAGYTKTCDPIHCNALTQTGCTASPVCTFTTSCEYISADHCTPVRLTHQDKAESEIVGLVSIVRPDLNIAIGAASQNMICAHQIKYISNVLVRDKTTAIVEAIPAQTFQSSGISFDNLFEPVTRDFSPTRPPPPNAPTPPPPTVQCDLVTDRVACVQNEACNWFGQLERCDRYDFNVPVKKEEVQLRDELSDLYLTLFIVTVVISGIIAILNALDVWQFCKGIRLKTNASFSEDAPPEYKTKVSTRSFL